MQQRKDMSENVPGMDEIIEGLSKGYQVIASLKVGRNKVLSGVVSLTRNPRTLSINIDNKDEFFGIMHVTEVCSVSVDGETVFSNSFETTLAT